MIQMKFQSNTTDQWRTHKKYYSDEDIVDVMTDVDWFSQWCGNRFTMPMLTYNELINDLQ